MRRVVPCPSRLLRAPDVLFTHLCELVTSELNISLDHERRHSEIDAQQRVMRCTDARSWMRGRHATVRQIRTTSLHRTRASATRAFRIPFRTARRRAQRPVDPARFTLCMRRFDQRPPQPRRPVAGDAPVPGVVRAPVDARHQAGVARQRGPVREALDVPTSARIVRPIIGPIPTARSARRPSDRWLRGAEPRRSLPPLRAGRGPRGAPGVATPPSLSPGRCTVASQANPRGLVQRGHGRIAAAVPEQQRPDHLRQPRADPHDLLTAPTQVAQLRGSPAAGCRC